MEQIKIIILALILTLNVGCITMPKGTDYQSSVRKVKDVDFLYDLTYEKNGEIKKEQNIFKRVFKEIDSAEKFLILDMFLFNNDGNKDGKYRKISKELSEKLIEKKEKNKDMEIYFITDPVNTFYGAYKIDNIEKMKEAGIVVIETNLNRLRDSNPIYSIPWRVFFSWFGTKGKGWLANPFGADSPKVTLRAYLKLMNFKANHRKVLISEKTALITSANPHDASSNHSNIAFVVKGDIINDVIFGEDAIAEFSKSDINIDSIEKKGDYGDIELIYLSEKKILKSVVKNIREAQDGDEINLAMFYFSHRKVIKELIKASKRGVKIRLILDANKDAFGREKNGIPNRLVANELYKKSDEKIEIRWYKTNGEQFHTKLLYIRGKYKSTVIGGSANYTKRNLNNYNLESVLLIKAKNSEKLVKEVDQYFNRIYNNRGGDYTLDYKAYAEDGMIKGGLYRFQEFSGISTF